MKKIYKNFILTAFIVTTLSSCSLFIEPMPPSWHWGLKPRPLTGVRGFPSAESSYGQGFKDGCGSAWDTMGKGMLSEWSDKAINPNRMVHDPDYAVGWEDAIEQCTYMLDWETL